MVEAEIPTAAPGVLNDDVVGERCAGVGHGYRSCGAFIVFVVRPARMSFEGAAVFTECRSVVFKVNVHFVQVFRLWCSLLFSFERRFFR
jgi:hypothetical protein